MHKGSYLRNVWNMMDFVVVVTGSALARSLFFLLTRFWNRRKSTNYKRTGRVCVYHKTHFCQHVLSISARIASASVCEYVHLLIRCDFKQFESSSKFVHRSKAVALFSLFSLTPSRARLNYFCHVAIVLFRIRVVGYNVVSTISLRQKNLRIYL